MLNTKDFPPLPSQTPRPKKLPKNRSPPKPNPPSKTHPTSLTDLPDELLLQILTYLPGINLQHFHLLTLASLSLTSRRLNRIVTEKLYAAYDSFFCTPYPFLRTVMSNPHLASHVKEISFRYGQGVHADRAVYTPSIPDKQLLKDSFKKLNIPDFDWKMWARECNDAHAEQEQLYASILLFTPNVARLEIGDGALGGRLPWWLVHFRQLVNGRAFGRVHRFEHLRSIRVDVHSLKLRHLAPVFGLRAVRRVEFVGLVEKADTAEDGSEALRRVLRASLVQEVYLERSFVEDGVLDVVVSCIERLRGFLYWSADSSDEGDAFNVRHRMLKSLQRHISCLETLSWRDDVEPEGVFDPGTPGLLHDFKRLIHIEVPMIVLVTQPQLNPSTAINLPHCVQSLTIHMPHEAQSYHACLDHMALHVHEHAPSLQSVKVVQYRYSPPTYDWRGFGKLLGKRGIRFEVGQAHAASDDGRWTPYGTGDASDESDSSEYEESLYSD